MKKFLVSHPLFRRIFLVVLWAFLCCGMIIVWKKEITPNISIDSLTVAYPKDTEVLLPGESIEEDIYWDKPNLDRIDIAFSYSEEISPDTQVMISVLRNDDLIANELLNLTALPNGRYLNFYLGQSNCAGSTFTIHIENMSDDPSSAFSLLSTDDEFYYLDKVSDYRYDGQMQNGRLLCQMYYTSSYSCYKAFAMISWLLLAGIFLTGMVLRLSDRQ